MEDYLELFDTLVFFTVITAFTHEKKKEQRKKKVIKKNSKY